MLLTVQLNRDSIIAAAISILDTYGLADMTMRRVASQLNVAPGALYWHFKNKQELIAVIAHHILQPIMSDTDGNAPDGADTKTPAAKDVCLTLRDAMIAHRDGAEVVSAALGTGSLREELQHQIANGLAHNAELGSFTLLHFVIGATLAEQSEHQLRELTSPDVDPILAGDEGHNRFAAALDVIIAGLASQ